MSSRAPASGSLALGLGGITGFLGQWASQGPLSAQEFGVFIALRVPPGSTGKGRSERARAALADPAWEPALRGSEELWLLCPRPPGDAHARAHAHTQACHAHTHARLCDTARTRCSCPHTCTHMACTHTCTHGILSHLAAPLGRVWSSHIPGLRLPRPSEPASLLRP